VILTATPASGRTFTAWEGCDTAAGTSCTVRPLASKSVTAIFSDGDEPPDPPVRPAPNVVPPGQAFLVGNRLFLRVKCPKRFRPSCRVRAVVLTKRNRGKAMTAPISLVVRSNRWRRAALRVRPVFQRRLENLSQVNRKTVVLRLNLTARRTKHGARKQVIHHRLRVRRP
jgi:hypothetical protein